MTDNEKMREEFEKWALMQGLDIADRFGLFYMNLDTFIAWNAWQAAKSVPVEHKQVADGLDEDIRQTMRFYSVTDLISLVRIQSEHVARLQKKLPPMRDERPRNPRSGGE